MSDEEHRIIVFRPFSILYLMFIIFLTFLLFPFLIDMWRILSHSLGVSPFIVFLIFLFSLLGSNINIRIGEVESKRPVLTYREIYFFGIRWFLPEIRYGSKTIVTLNVGGALIPLLFSLYLLFYVIPLHETNVMVAYLKILIAFIVIAMVVHSVARPIRGLGIATPSLIPPLTTAVVAALLYTIYVRTNPFIIAYVAGTLGTLVGADLLNLNKIPELGSPIVSIGGAGTFDGIYITGIMAVFLLWLIM
jgi:uncharacterized membrane protein